MSSSTALPSVSSINASLGSFRRRFVELLDLRNRFSRNSLTPGSPIGDLPEASSWVSFDSAMAETTESSFSFACSVCLETLDQPASIDLQRRPGQMPANPVVSAPMPVLIDVEMNETLAVDSGGVRRRSSTRGRRSTVQPVNESDADRTTVVATHCGHLYHQVCLMKWFRDFTGRRSCPTCRKVVPNSKVIRLYPSSSTDSDAGPSTASSRNQNAPGPTCGNEPVPSTSSGLGGPIPVASAVNGECAGCGDLTIIHNTLIRDYGELQERNRNLDERNIVLRNNEILKDTQIESLMEDNNRKDAQMVLLQRELEVFRGSDGGNPSLRTDGGNPSLRRSTRKTTTNKRLRRI